MKKDTKIIIITLVLMILMSCYRPLINEVAPNLNKYIETLIRKLLQAITIIIYITKLRLWKDVGLITKVSKEGLLLLLPVVILSFIPIFNGVKVIGINIILVILIITFLIGIIEELVFRGIILSALKQRGKKSAILISSAIFGLFHLFNLIYGADILDTVVQVIFAFGFGLIMAVVRYETDLLLPQIIVHALWDFIFKISNTDFKPTIDTIHSISLVLILLWGLFLTFRVYKKHDDNFYLKNEVGL